MIKNKNYKELSKELIEECKKLIELPEDEIYLLLGAQILGQQAPTKVAGIITYISATSQLDRETKFIDTLPSEKLLPESLAGINILIQELKKEGKQYFLQVEQILKKSICTKEGLPKKKILDSLDKGIEYMLKVIIPIVCVGMGLHAILYPVAITISAIIIKIGINNFCKLQ